MGDLSAYWEELLSPAWFVLMERLLNVGIGGLEWPRDRRTGERSGLRLGDMFSIVVEGSQLR